LGHCTATDVVVITVESQVNVNAGPDQLVLSGDLVQLNAIVTGATTYLWTPTPSDPSLSSATMTNPTATPLVTTTYSMTATNAAGCTSTDEVVVTVVPYCIRLRNAFSPNGDGINELWQVYDQFDCLTNVVARVYNRYGNVIFEDKNYKNTWDGKYKGKPVPDGTYYAVVEYTLVSGKKIVSRTDVNIIR
jgi:gliding motility-associated-like protein